MKFEWHISRKTRIKIKTFVFYLQACSVLVITGATIIMLKNSFEQTKIMKQESEKQNIIQINCPKDTVILQVIDHEYQIKHHTKTVKNTKSKTMKSNAKKQ